MLLAKEHRLFHLFQEQPLTSTAKVVAEDRANSGWLLLSTTVMPT